MVLSRWSINLRLIIVQLVLGVLIICLRDVAREMRFNRQLEPLDESDSQVGPELLQLADLIENESTGSKSSILKHNPLQSNRIKQCPTLPRPKSQTSGTIWSAVRLDGEAMIYVYSAFEDSRQDKNYDGEGSVNGYETGSKNVANGSVIRLLVLARSDFFAASGQNKDGAEHRSKRPVFCHLWKVGNEPPITVEGRVVRLDSQVDEGDQGKLIESFIECLPTAAARNVFSDGGSVRMPHQLVPEHVSLTIGSQCPDTDDEVALFRVRRQPVNSESATSDKRRSVAICVAPTRKESLEAWSRMRDIDSVLKAPWLIEWMELLAMFGTEQVIMYTTFTGLNQLTQSTRQLIEFYLNRKSLPKLTLLPLVLPAEDAKLSGIAFNDCLLRCQGVRYVVPSAAADQIIVPRQAERNYSSMFDRINSARRSAVLSLRGATFSTDATNAVEDSLLTTIRFRSRGKLAPIVRHVVEPARCARLRPSGLCAELVTKNGSGFLKSSDVFNVPPPIGSWHQYRACESEPVKKCAVDLDNALLRFQKQIQLNVVQTMKDSGLLRNDEDIQEVALQL